MRLAPVLLILIVVAFHHNSSAGEVQFAAVDYRQGIYSLVLDVVIDAGFDAVYAVITDYENLHQLNDTFIGSALIDSPDKEILRRRVVARSCFLIFCFTVDIVEDVEEIGKGFIVATIVPDEGDFKSGKATWHLTSYQDGRCRLLFRGKEEPAFWIPPVIGPILVKRKIMREALETMERIELLAKND